MIGVVSMAKNVELWIDTAIRSVFENNVKVRIYVAYESGASHDHTDLKLRWWSEQDNRVILVKKAQRKNVAEAANDSARAVIEDGCKYLARLDMDNYYLPFGLRMLYDNIRGRDLVWGDHIRIDISGNVVGYSQSPNFITAGELLRGLNRIPGNAVIMRAEAWEQCPWLEELVGGWDLAQFVMMMAKGFRLQKLHDEWCIPVVVERQREGMFQESLSSGRWAEWRNQLIKLAPEIRELAIRTVSGGK